MNRPQEHCSGGQVGVRGIEVASEFFTENLSASSGRQHTCSLREERVSIYDSLWEHRIDPTRASLDKAVAGRNSMESCEKRM